MKSTFRQWLSRAARSARVRRSQLAMALLVIVVAAGALGPMFSPDLAGPAVRRVFWVPAAPDLFTRTLAEGEVPTPLESSVGAVNATPRQYSMTFDLNEMPDGPVGLYVPVSGGKFRAFLNRVPLRGQTDTRVLSPILYARGQLVELPRALLHTDDNRIDVVVSEAAPHTWPRAFYIDDPARLKAAIGRQALIFETIRNLGFGLATISLIITLGLAASERRLRRLWAAGGLLLLAWVMFALPYAAEFHGFARNARLAADLLIPIAALAVSRLFAGRAVDIWRDPPTVGMIAMVPLTAAALWTTGVAASVDALVNFISVTMTLLAIVAGVWIWARSGAGRFQPSLVTWLTVLALVAVSVSRLDIPGRIVALVAENFAAIAVLLALGLWLGRMSQLLVSEASTRIRHRRTLAATISDQEQRLGEQAAIIDQESRRRAMLEERERMTRDIHDGIGGQLLSLLIRVRSDRASKEEIEREIQGGLNDLRLIVDSLDHTDASLGAALTTFHSRLLQQLDAAGIRLLWRVDEALLPEISDPRLVLQIYRILQELLTNVVRHSGASEVEILISGSDMASEVNVAVLDNGIGLAAKPSHKGKGLTNITRRMEALGGHFLIANNDRGPGVRVTLTVPAPRTGLTTPPL